MIKTVQLFFVFLLFSILYSLFSIPVFAQTAPPPNTNPDVPNNMHTYTQSVMVEVMAAMTCQLTGIDPINPSQQCLGIDSASKKIGFVDPSAGSGQAGGAIGFAGNMIAVLYTPPLHTGDYFSYLAQNFGIAKPAYAQEGAGFRGLNPLLNIWSAFRNIVYLLFVIVFIVIGLAIMLRLHIDPRTVMTIENQIPKIIIGLIMVTFSFAISGFLIDLMYVSIYTVHGTIQGIGIKDKNDKNVADDFKPADMQGKSPFAAVGGLGSPVTSGGINGMVNNAAVSIKGVFNGMLGVTGFVETDEGKGFIELNESFPFIHVNTRIAVFPTGSIMNWFYNILSIFGGIGTGAKLAQITTNVGTLPVIGGTGSSLGGAIIGFPIGYMTTQALLREALPWLIAYLVIFIAVLWALFRLWFQLIIAYIYILIDVVFAPFWILAGLFPGSQIGFGSWLRDIVANLSSFPVAIGMFMLGKVFMNAFSNNKDAFVPPLIGDVGHDGQSIIGSLIGIGIILMTPQVVTMMRDFLKAPNLKYTAAIGQAVGAGTGVITGATKSTAGIGTAYLAGDPYNKETRGISAVGRMFQRRFFGGA